ncbi:MAG TPA: hypothetical protein DGB85_03930 [Deltaproteobacteria bacterium]|nr:hypothetical protein [Deltaproteobacteria bacterium]
MPLIIRSEINPILFQATKTSLQQHLSQFLFRFHEALAKLSLLHHRCFEVFTEQRFNISFLWVFSSKYVQLNGQEHAEITNLTGAPALTVLCKQLLSQVGYPVMISFVKSPRNNRVP